MHGRVARCRARQRRARWVRPWPGHASAQACSLRHPIGRNALSDGTTGWAPDPGRIARRFPEGPARAARIPYGSPVGCIADCLRGSKQCDRMRRACGRERPSEDSNRTDQDTFSLPRSCASEPLAGSVVPRHRHPVPLGTDRRTGWQRHRSWPLREQLVELPRIEQLTRQTRSPFPGLQRCRDDGRARSAIACRCWSSSAATPGVAAGSCAACASMITLR